MEAARTLAAVYYTDGSINHLTGAVGDAYVTEGHTAIFRLPDGSTQAELVAISQALRHAVEWGRDPSRIHCDSVPAIRSLFHKPLG